MLAQDFNTASFAGEAQASNALSARTTHWDEVDAGLLQASGLKAARAAIECIRTAAPAKIGGGA